MLKNIDKLLRIKDTIKEVIGFRLSSFLLFSVIPLVSLTNKSFTFNNPFVMKSYLVFYIIWELMLFMVVRLTLDERGEDGQR